MDKLITFIKKLRQAGYQKFAQQLNELTPEATDLSRRYHVDISWPEFSDDGKPFFGPESFRETLSMNAVELEDYKRQAEKGYMKINSIKPSIPKRR